MSAIGLYSKLYEFSDSKNILVFDDCDSILLDDVALNLLKGALDSGKKRVISWLSESSALRREGIPDRFEFKGSVIFITNLKFDKMKINREELFRMYMEWVNHVSDECDWKTHFTPEEIVHSIASILENNPNLINNE